MPNPTLTQRAHAFPGKKRLRAWRCPHCVEEFKKDHIPRNCMFDSRDKSYVGDHWCCGSVRLMRWMMIQSGVRLIVDERESMTTTRWRTLSNGARLIVTWRRGRPRLLAATVVDEIGAHPLRWDEFQLLCAEFQFPGDEELDQTAYARGYKMEQEV